jgi:hypothetical protein
LAQVSQASRVSTPGAHAAEDTIENLIPSSVTMIGCLFGLAVLLKLQLRMREES